MRSWPWWGEPPTGPVEGWRSIPDLPVEIARQCDPSRHAWVHENYRVGSRSIVYDLDGEWYRIYVTKDNDVYYQRWVTL